ncbi:MAG: chromosomal replication initiator protein DnaA [Bacteriovoracaceae bacterium]
MENNFPFQFLKIKDELKTQIPETKTPKSSYQEDVKPSIIETTVLNKGGFSFEEIQGLNQAVHSFIQGQIDAQKYQTYFSDNFHLSRLENDNLVFTVTTGFIKKIIETNYMALITKSVKLTLGKEYNIGLELLGEIATEVNKENESAYSVKKGATVKDVSFSINDLMPTKSDLIDQYQAKVIEELAPVHKSKRIDPSKLFENFVVGSSNNLAFASCEAVANNPGKDYPSLYLHSASGLGKTHLIYALANRIKTSKPHLNICMITGNEFVDDYVKSVQNRKFQEFQERYTVQTDVLIIDDIHELKNKNETQNAFFNIFNELHNKGKQLIFTSDKAPKDINGIEERVKTRLGWGLIVDIQQPDLETRIAILKRKAAEKDIYVPDDVVNLIASAIKSNVRELEASLIRLGLYSSVCKVDIDVEIAKEQLKLSDHYSPDSITFDSIIKEVANYYKLSISDIRSKVRTKEFATARHVGMYLTHKIIKPTLMEIGDFYGKRDHTTVMHAINKIEQQIRLDQRLAQTVLEIENSL